MTSPSSRLGSRIVAIGGALVFVASLLYGFYAYGRVFRAIVAPSAQPAVPILINLVLFAAFGAHHSLFARTGLKTRVRAWFGPEIERSIYVWIASVLFFAMTWLWQPVGGTLWAITTPWVWLLHIIQFSGAVLALSAGRRVDALELAGIGPLLGHHPRVLTAPVGSGPYHFVRHPLYLAFLLGVWPVSPMTGTRFEFALLFTLYLLMAIPLEERDLRRSFGAGYDQYAQRVRFRLVPGLY